MSKDDYTAGEPALSGDRLGLEHDIPEIPIIDLKDEQPLESIEYGGVLIRHVATINLRDVAHQHIKAQEYSNLLRLLDARPNLAQDYGKEFADALYQTVLRQEKERSNLTLHQIQVLEILNRKGARLDLDEVVLQYYARLQPDGRWRSRGNDYQMYLIYVPDFFGKESVGGRSAYRKAVQEAKSAVVSRIKVMLLDGADEASLPQANYQPGKLKRDKAVKIKVTLGELVAKQ